MDELRERVLDPLQRAITAGARLAEAQADVNGFAAIRAEAVLELVAGGWSYSQIAAELGVTKSAVQKMVAMGEAHRAASS